MVESVGEALLLLADMNHWAKWDDESLLLNMKREAIMVTNFSLPPYCSFSILFYYFIQNFKFKKKKILPLLYGSDINVLW